MTEKVQKTQGRVPKRLFLRRVSENTRINPKTVNRVYDAILEELMDTMRRGDQLMLTGFGKFYPQAHKGHRVQFSESGAEAIEDYHVLKFSATRSVNRGLEEEPTSRPDVPEGLFVDDAELDDAETNTDDADLDEEFEQAAPKVKAPAKTKAQPKTTESKAPKKAPARKGTASLAAAAIQSPRTISRARREAQGKVATGPAPDQAI